MCHVPHRAAARCGAVVPCAMLRHVRLDCVTGVARVLPIGPGGAQSGFSTLRYVSRDFRQNKTGPWTPRPPGGPPVLGSLFLSP
jgi:hypothetical protein